MLHSNQAILFNHLGAPCCARRLGDCCGKNLQYGCTYPLVKSHLPKLTLKPLNEKF
ncbi:hypothetical protein PILCRDRAFT_825944, partial [Piloderma croceum F 1598]